MELRADDAVRVRKLVRGQGSRAGAWQVAPKTTGPSLANAPGEVVVAAESVIAGQVRRCAVDPGAGEWDGFVERTSGHYTQSSMWADLKAMVGWQAERVAVREGGRIVGGTQVLLRRVGVLGTIALVPSSPLTASGNQLLGSVIDHLMDLCVCRGLIWLKLQPTSVGSNGSEDLEGLLLERGFVRSDLAGRDEASTRVELTDPDRMLASMRPGLRANIRKAQRKGAVSVRIGGEDDLETFTDLLVATAARQSGMQLFPRAYYAQAWRSFASRGCGRLLVAEHLGQPLSAILLVTHGDTCEYLYGGWNRERPDLHPNEFLQWSGMQWAREQGFRWYDLGNMDSRVARRMLAGERVPTDAAIGQTRYKLGFGGQAILNPPAYDQTGRRILRPALRLLAPHLKLAMPIVKRARGLVS
jgi:lipid II:glycine glycyltransferase (peptidoglycan interpeptide bridge formation enzyme)